MTKTKLFAFLSMILLSFAVLSCSNGDDDGGEPGGGNGNPPAGDLKAGQVQIKGYADSYSKKIVFYATAKKLTIDWGDGIIEEITPNGNGREFSHTYENATIFQTISINTDDLTEIRFAKNSSFYDGDIRELRFGACPKLKKIGGLYDYYDSYLPNLTVFDINRAESLEQLSFYRTYLTELNLNGCINLITLCVTSNDKLTSLDVSKCTKLEILDCSYNRLTSLNVSGCTKLEGLGCSDNQLTSLDVSKCTNLTELWCYSNQLTSLDVNKCTNLTELSCSDNQLTSLNVSGCTKLEGLYCSRSQLTSLDVSKCTNLKSLNCYNNQLTSLNVSKCTNLTELSCSDNQLSATALNSLFTGLPVRTAADYAWINCERNPGSESCNPSIAENKGWNVYNY
jgi:Leucine-rich repeat (LRR) protein